MHYCITHLAADVALALTKGNGRHQQVKRERVRARRAAVGLGVRFRNQLVDGL